MMTVELSDGSFNRSGVIDSASNSSQQHLVANTCAFSGDWKRVFTFCLLAAHLHSLLDGRHQIV